LLGLIMLAVLGNVPIFRTIFYISEALLPLIVFM